MKKIISWGMMLAAAFTLTNCAKEIDNPNEQPEAAGYPFEIVASTVDTKTVNDGMSTKWAEGDQINLFHAVSNGTDYKNNGAFTVKDTESGNFTGELCETLDAEAMYDWYALYPYNQKITTPGEREDGFTYIGYSKGLYQTGYNSMASLKGSTCPLYGVMKSCPAGDTPLIEMNHLSSVVAINVTNMNEEPLTVTTASLTAEEDIVGSYYIDLTKTPVVYTKSDDNYVYKTATVNVTSGATALAQGQSAILYLAIKPFTAKEGSKLVLSVEGYEKEITMTKDVTFAAGKIKTLNFSYDKEETPVPEGQTEVEIVSSDLGIDNGVEVTSVENGLLQFAQGTNSTNPPKYYSSGSAVRMYVGNKLTVNAPEGCVLTKIEFTFVSGYATSLTCTNSNGYTDGTWTGALNTVEFEVTGTTQARIAKMVVTYMIGEAEAAEITSIEVVEPKTDYFVNTDFVAPKVNAIYSNGTIAEVEGAEFSGYDLSSLGEQTVTVTYGDFTTTYIINVEEAAGVGYSLYEGELVEGDYIIVYDGGAMDAVVSSSRLGYKDVEVVGDVIYEPDESVVWHIAKSASYWTIYNASTGTYAAGTGAKNKAQLLASGTDDKSLWTASGTSTYEFVNKANEAAGVNKNLRRNGTYGFACYSTSTGGALTLYKKN